MEEEKKTYPLVVISGPSGAGEDSVIKGLEKLFPIEKVITTVTREMRPGDRQGDPYNFVSEEEYKRMLSAGEFFESAQHYNNNYYGTTNEEIERVRNSGKIGMLKIDYQGVEEVKEKMPGIVTIFINAPLDILEKRIRRRSVATDEYVAERMAYTKEWLKHIDLYDYKVENEEGKLDQTIEKVARIVKKELGLDKKG